MKLLINTSNLYVGEGFNATTFIQPYFLDFGYFYWLEMILVFSIYSALILLAKKINFVGIYVFFLMLFFLMLFGDYFVNRTMFVTIVMSFLVFPFLKIQNKVRIK
ncbi:MAG: hypothetical protein PHN18_12150 [Sulfurospirillaceae bacterium]|nr:hypothetical protein [Sulfurospirillaceae bacterium]MDD2826355.1 hypothetical protein [Sulfurospirillaceae bacterium]